MISVEGLNARAGSFHLRDITFSVPRGAWAVVLGAAGSGKTTLLETIAGVRRTANGRVLLRGTDASALPPEQRKLGMVYQQSMLFPHLSVEENVSYGVSDRSRGTAMIARFAIDGLLGRKVNTLSGGERQLVALARALAPEPDILLLDEPFSALDPRRRAAARSVLRTIVRERSCTVVQVTHDFAEAGVLGDVIIVMHDGRVVQTGTVDEVFHAPASPIVADFMGAENVLSGTVVPENGAAEPGTGMHRFIGNGIELVGVGTHAGGAGHAIIRGENVTLSREPTETSARNTLGGTIVDIVPEGVLSRVFIAVGGETIVATITRNSVGQMNLLAGQQIAVSIKATAVHIC